MILIVDEVFEANDFRSTTFVLGEYENCKFVNCNFEGLNLSDYRFLNCRFSGCNLSLIIVQETIFRDVDFKNCKMLGLAFEKCAHFGMTFHFENCNLNHASFYKIKIKGTTFTHCSLHEVDFGGCDLTSSVFDTCDFMNASFDQTILIKANFNNSINIGLDPENNKIKNASFPLNTLPGLLQKHQIKVLY